MPSYLIGSLYFCVQGYILMHMRRELISEKYYAKMSTRRWKHVLEISQDAVMICGPGSVLYHNRALRDMLQAHNIGTDKINEDVILLLYELKLR